MRPRIRFEPSVQTRTQGRLPLTNGQTNPAYGRTLHLAFRSAGGRYARQVVIDGTPRSTFDVPNVSTFFEDRELVDWVREQAFASGVPCRIAVRSTGNRSLSFDVQLSER